MSIRFDDVSDGAAESLATEWGSDSSNEDWGAMVGWAAGLLHDGSDDDEDEDGED